jgi:hypothetical protein
MSVSTLHPLLVKKGFIVEDSASSANSQKE